jgi:phage/plasmid primase-like uncharacterized protein
MMLGEKLNIGHDPSQHVAYVGSWIKALKEDPKEIFRAASDSEKITHFIMEPQHRIQKLENVHKIRVNVPQKAAQEEGKEENNKIQIRFSPAFTQEQQLAQQGNLENTETAKKENTLFGFQLPDFFLDENQHKVYDLKESGQVRVADDGIYLDQMTDEAMMAAMTLAVEHYPDIQMDLSGPPEVHQRSVELAIQNNIPIQFSDPLLQAKMLNHQRDAETQSNAVGEGAKKRMSERIYLAVPYEDRNEAKALGAKWDKNEKAWFVQGDMDEQFQKWEKGKNEPALQQRIDPLTEFGDALKSAGLILDGAPVMDGRMRRIPVEGDDKGQASGAYIGYSDGHPAGFIQNHKTGFKQNWKSSQKADKISDIDRQRLEAELQEKNEARLQERKAVATQTAEAVAAHWVAGEVVNEHPYLTAKGVNSYGLRANTLGFLPLQGNEKEGEPQHWGNKGHLMVPVMDIDGRFLAAQSIDGSGRKSFPRGSSLQGGHFVIGEIKPNQELLIAEGYATSATLHELTGKPVVVAFHSGNLPVVAQAYREKHPAMMLIIAGDNDHHKPDEKNVGRLKALDAAQKVNGYPLLPNFGKMSKGTDWNDLTQEIGKEAVRLSLNHGLAVIEKKISQKLDLNRERTQVQTRELTRSGARALSR